MKRCLVVGDGNFSFSRCLAAMEDIEIVATSFASREDVLSVHPTAESHVSALKQSGAVVLHGVDATDLRNNQNLKGLFHSIVFNFPHIGGKSNIAKNRHLLKLFFISASKLLYAVGGLVKVSLCRGQGGTADDDLKRGHHNSWKVVEMAAEAGLILTKVEPFPAEEYHDYKPTGYRGGSKSFVLEGALTHTFMFPGVARSIYPPSYVHDISFWSNSFSTDEFETTVRRIGQDFVHSVECIDVYRPACYDTRTSHCYRVVYSSETKALSKSTAAELQQNLRDTIQSELGLHLR